MKRLIALAALAVAAGCTTKSSDAPVVASTTPTAATQTQQVVPGSQEDLERTVGHRIYFAYDQHSLSQQARAQLDRQAQWMKQYPRVAVTVAGNCDERGTREYNLALGARRAEAARAYLVSLGVEPGRLTAVSYGKERPIAPGASETAWSQNRNATSTVSRANS